MRKHFLQTFAPLDEIVLEMKYSSPLQKLKTQLIMALLLITEESIIFKVSSSKEKKNLRQESSMIH